MSTASAFDFCQTINSLNPYLLISFLLSNLVTGLQQLPIADSLSPSPSFRRRRGSLPAPRVPALLGGFKEFLDGFGVRVFQRELEFLQILHQHTQDAGKVFAVRQRDIAPHLR